MFVNDTGDQSIEVAKALGNVCRTNTERTGTYAEYTHNCAHLREGCQERMGTYESEIENCKLKGTVAMNA